MAILPVSQTYNYKDIILLSIINLVQDRFKQNQIDKN